MCLKDDQFKDYSPVNQILKTTAIAQNAILLFGDLALLHDLQYLSNLVG